MATGIARAANLCLPLVEAIALAHDCGHGPAGHASEEAFSPFLPGTGYDHAVYGADVTLAPLNLCVETLDGVRNHSWRRPAPATPEGEVVAWADRIAYVCHDFEDAVRAGILEPADLPAEVRDVVGTPAVGADRRVRARGARRHRPHRRGRDDRAGGRRRSPSSGRSTSSGSTCGPRRGGRPTRVIRLLGDLVEHFADAPRRIPLVRDGEVPAPVAGLARGRRARGALRERHDRPLRARARRRAPRVATRRPSPRRLRRADAARRPLAVIGIGPMGILDEDVARVRDATDLVALASEHLALKRVGKRFVGLCPFHAEKTPSFSSTPRSACTTASVARRAVTRSRSCARSSTSTSSTRSSGSRRVRASRSATTTRRSPRTAVARAAPERSGRRRDRLLPRSCCSSRPRAALARRYLRGRGLRRRRGAPVPARLVARRRGTALSVHLQQQKFARDDIVDAGLAFVNKVNKLQDQFRGRLHVPDLRQRGRSRSGFGGRALGDDGPKYKNSPETPIYQKSRLLYGLNWAKGEIVGRGRGRHLRGLHRRHGVRARRRAERGRHLRHRARRRPLPDPQEPRPQGGARLRLRRRRPGRGREVVRVGAALRDPARRSPTCPPGAIPPTCGTTTPSSCCGRVERGQAVPAVPPRPGARGGRPRHPRGAGPCGRAGARDRRRAPERPRARPVRDEAGRRARHRRRSSPRDAWRATARERERGRRRVATPARRGRRRRRPRAPTCASTGASSTCCCRRSTSPSWSSTGSTRACSPTRSHAARSRPSRRRDDFHDALATTDGAVHELLERVAVEEPVGVRRARDVARAPDGEHRRTGRAARARGDATRSATSVRRR